MKYNGYHSEIGSFKKSRTKYFLKYINSITKNFDLKKNDTILDVRCGAGAFLFPFFKRGMKCHGIDYSKNSIKICRKFITNGKFVVGEANNLNKFKKNKYDIISSAAVFQYFDNINYAKRVFNQMNKQYRKYDKNGNSLRNRDNLFQIINLV